MAYSTINKSTDYFNSKTYTGNTPGQSITGIGFKPDLSWFKGRVGNGYDHSLRDSLRGTLKHISSNNNTAETDAANSLLSFDTDGFTLGTDNRSFVNENNTPHIAWNWLAGTTGSGNTQGSGTYKAYSYSVNTVSGISIIKYKGNGTSGHQIPHHLGVSPSMTIIKKLSGDDNWIVQSESRGWNKRLILDTTNAEATHTDFVSAVSSTTLSLYTNGSVNGNDADYIAYVFAEKTGYSKFGTYLNSNNNVAGPFIYTGFAPKFLILRNCDVTEHWVMHDNLRPGYNGNGSYIYPNLNNAEITNNTDHTVDLLSNGFKVRSSNDQWNDTGEPFFFMAFGQSLVGSNNVPCTAR